MTIAEIPLLIPLTFLIPAAVLWARPDIPGKLSRRVGIASSWLGLFWAVVVAVLVSQFGTLDEGSVFGLHADPLSVVLLLLLATLSLVIQKYSAHYLAGEPKQTQFVSGLLLIGFAISCFVLARHLLTLFVAWQLVSSALHRLLTFFPSRPAALRAARKKFIVSRIGDLFLVASLVLAYDLFGTLDLPQIFEVVAQGSGHPFDPFLVFGWDTGMSSLEMWGVLLALGAMTKSAQVPFHFWLPDTMEAPTPVSALMHAGVINAGGILLTRLSPILVHSPTALHLLFVVGTVTAFFGALTMLVQSDVKRSLAYSTIGQMGFMMMQVGLGAFTAAIFHLCTHALFKAYAFLSAGGDVARRPIATSRMVGSQAAAPVLALGSAAAAVVFAVALSEVSFREKSGGFVLLAFYGASIAQIFYSVARSREVSFSRYLGVFAAVTTVLTSYFVVLHSLELFFAPILPVAALYQAFDTLAAPVAEVTLVAFLLTWLVGWWSPKTALVRVRNLIYVAALRKFYLEDALSLRRLR
jgi:NAD(P)H-quinone oxidoreductase subunit 5